MAHGDGKAQNLMLEENFSHDNGEDGVEIQQEAKSDDKNKAKGKGTK